MKNTYITLCLVLGLVLGLQAQDCATGYCPPTITVHHNTLRMSAETITITYEVVETNVSGANKCWITRNLGATSVPTTYDDVTVAAAGWYWQFNQSNAHSPSFYSNWVGSFNPGTTDWLPANDPCAQLLGNSWRLPTGAEWINFDTNFPVVTLAELFSSVLRLHAAGYFNSSAILGGLGISARYWSSTHVSSDYAIAWDGVNTSNAGLKVQGLPVRCLKDL